MNGNFEVVDAAPYQRPGRVLRQMTPLKPILWLRADTTPHAIIGDPAWQDTTVTTDIYLQAQGHTAALALHCHGLDVDNTACLWLRVTAGAAGSGSNGSWGVYLSAGDMANASVLPRAAGAVALAPSQWHTLTLASTRGAATATLDGTPLLSGQSFGEASAGFAGLGTAAYGHFTAFDNLNVSAPVPPPPPACDAGLALPAAPLLTPACTPVAGSVLRTVPCGSGAAWVWTATGGGKGTLSPAAAPGLCAAINASNPERQTGAPQVELQVCLPAGGGGAALLQQWGQPPQQGAPLGAIVGQGAVNLEVTKNILGEGVPLEVWRSNGGANQMWCALKSGEFMSGLNAVCAGAC